MTRHLRPGRPRRPRPHRSGPVTEATPSQPGRPLDARASDAASYPGDQARIRLRGPGEVIVTLPYHLGYQPEESLVLVCLEGRRVTFVGRIDLPPHHVDPWVAVDELIPPVLREAPERALIIAFEREEGQSEPLSALVAGVLRDEDIEVTDRLVVRDGRYWSQECTGSCCPPEGAALPEHTQVPAVADYVLLGRRPAPSRSGLDDLLRPDPGTAARLESGLALARRHEAASRSERSALFTDPGAELHDLRRIALTQWARLLDVVAPDDVSDDQVDDLGDAPAGEPCQSVRDPSGLGFTDDTWLLLAASLRDVHLRDLLVAWLCPGTLDLAQLDHDLVELAVAVLPAPILAAGDGDVDALTWVSAHEEVTDRLMRLCRQTPAELSAAPLTVLANHTWWHGDGTLTRIALERALGAEPDYRLARLLERMVDLAIRPRGRVA